MVTQRVIGLQKRLIRTTFVQMRALRQLTFPGLGGVAEPRPGMLSSSQAADLDSV